MKKNVISVILWIIVGFLVVLVWHLARSPKKINETTPFIDENIEFSWENFDIVSTWEDTNLSWFDEIDEEENLLNNK